MGTMETAKMQADIMAITVLGMTPVLSDSYTNPIRVLSDSPHESYKAVIRII